MKKQAKKIKSAPKRFRRLPLVTVIVAIAVLAIGAVTVLSRQAAQVKAANAQERGDSVTKQKDKSSGTGPEAQANSRARQERELTPEEERELGAGLKQLINKSVADRALVYEADGSMSIDLEGRFQHVTVVKVDEDGNVSQSCVDNPKSAGAFFNVDPKLIENEKGSTTQQIQIKPLKKEK